MTPVNDRAAWFLAGEARCNLLPTVPERPCRLVLLGPPGVGKGTQAELLCSTFGTCHLSTGDVFRCAFKTAEEAQSPAIRTALQAMKHGDLVSDDTVIELVKERSGCLRCSGGFLLDGFPRTIEQAHMLDSLLDTLELMLDAVLYYELPSSEIVERLSGRRTCVRCKAVYHVTARPSRLPGTCDLCESELVQREDDIPEAIAVRLHAYEESTRPLVDLYASSGRLVTIRAEGSPEDIHGRAVAALQARWGNP